jgi:hypothetical protein
MLPLGAGDKCEPRPPDLRLTAEVRRLRKLVIDVEPYVPDTEQTRTMDLPALLKAEVERKQRWCLSPTLPRGRE